MIDATKPAVEGIHLREDSSAVNDQALMPYDENLLEKARVQWQFGDWLSLTRIERSTLQHHPERAKLALLASAGHLQLGRTDVARQFIQLAHDWGCNRKLVTQILIAGVHNSLAKTAALTGDYSRAIKHIEKSVAYGASGSDIRLFVRARASEQFIQLGLSPPERLEQDQLIVASNIKAFQILDTPDYSPISVEKFFSEDEKDRNQSLAELKLEIEQQQLEEILPDVEFTSARHRQKDYWFVHFKNDYIPSKIAEKNQFYESPFLNLLARLHQSGKLIVDGGANIGNHTVFFAGVMGADVIAFEPQQYNYEFLVANVYLNKLEAKVDARKKAIGESAGVISLVQAISDNYGSFTSDLSQLPTPTDRASSANFTNICLSTIDKELEEHKCDVSIIKLDLEGMELDALRGAREVIASSLPVIAVECFTKSIFQEIKDYLSTFDYFVIDSTNATPTFIFVTRRNQQHLEMLSKYLEMSSVGKFSSNQIFNEAT